MAAPRTPRPRKAPVPAEPVTTPAAEEEITASPATAAEISDLPEAAAPVVEAVETVAELTAVPLPAVEAEIEPAPAPATLTVLEPPDEEAALPSVALEETAQRVAEDVLAFTKDQVEKASHSVISAYDGAADLHKENVEALIQASTILAGGLEALTRNLLTFSQSRAQSGANAAKALLGVKTLKELVDLQAELARASFDAYIAEAARVSELSAKVAADAVAPLKARLSVTLEALTRKAA